MRLVKKVINFILCSNILIGSVAIANETQNQNFHNKFFSAMDARDLGHFQLLAKKNGISLNMKGAIDYLEETVSPETLELALSNKIHPLMPGFYDYLEAESDFDHRAMAH